jgi:hypothetical protein
MAPKRSLAAIRADAASIWRDRGRYHHWESERELKYMCCLGGEESELAGGCGADGGGGCLEALTLLAVCCAKRTKMALVPLKVAH